MLRGQRCPREIEAKVTKSGWDDSEVREGGKVVEVQRWGGFSGARQ